MSSSISYFNFIKGQLAFSENISYRKMMGEYLIYYRKKVVAGIYDDRFLCKITPFSTEFLNGAERTLPYETGKEMYLVECVDEPERLFLLLRGIYEDLNGVHENL